MGEYRPIGRCYVTYFFRKTHSTIIFETVTSRIAQNLTCLYGAEEECHPAEVQTLKSLS